MRLVLGRLISFSLICFLSNNIYAGAKTNVNKTTDLFDQNIKNKGALFEDLTQKNDNAVNSIKSKEAFGLIEGSKGAEQNASQLNSIKATDLDNAGRDKRNSEEFKFYDENELEPDYTKSGNKQHKLDADEISQLTAKKLFDLKTKLNELGLDCRTVKGAVEKEPTYYIEMTPREDEKISKRGEQKNTEYDQFFCEEPRGKYTCNDEVTVRCIRKGKRYGEWQPRTKRFDGHWIYANAMNWGYAIKWKVGRWGWHITPYHPKRTFFQEMQVDSTWRNDPGAIIADARRLIAQEEKAAIEQISENITFPDNNSGRGIGNTIELGQSQRWRVIWQWYDFHYQYRDMFDVCEAWAEEWTERCRLQ